MADAQQTMYNEGWRSMARGHPSHSGNLKIN